MGKRYDFPVPFGWYAVSLSRELAAGEVKPLQYFGKELVLFRTEGGEARLLDAFCPHLGAHLGYGGKVKGEHIACPFHAWEFSGEGVCKHIPYAKNMPPRADGKQTVFSYPVVERNQIVWAWYHPERITPQWEVETVPEVGDADWTEYRVYEWTFRAPIQEAAENAADAAHFVRSGAGLCHDLADTFDGAAPPQVGVLLRPTRSWRLQLIGPRSGGDGAPIQR